MSSVEGVRVLLAVGGGISAYKSAELCRELVRRGAIVSCAMTRAAQSFVAPLTFQALSGRRVATSLMDASEEAEIGHIRLADENDLCIVAPATANLIARIAAGMGDDVVTTVLLATRARTLLAPAMNVNMWRNPIVQANLRRLLEDGRFETIGPGVGDLACGWVGEGRMAEPLEIVEAAQRCLRRDLEGRAVVVTAGPTVEDIDPVRFLGNRSSGRMGYAVAQAAARRGAKVTLISGPTSLATPPGAERTDVRGALEMRDQLARAAASADVVVMAAAVADYRPASPSPSKLKRDVGTTQLDLVPNPDILAELGARRDGGRLPVLVGFAVETEDLEANARQKLEKKKVDLVVANRAEVGFGGAENEALLVSREGVQALARMSKDDLADRILDRVCELLSAGGSATPPRAPPP
ncbi:MAG: bifunctional phosphopantothenoylcysteine decarboxylase/phosphopantothenate--cysteine ligase CoaBC [Deltaproteobacteria bacterium]|nr:bifunctional phosphopantothenoylcysteine decarboxylase/phosphopantothenate--cysteine ligase CoaBC [Deltaproteobacteria bacterium]